MKPLSVVMTATLLAFATTALPSAGASVKTQLNPKIDFASLKTFAWRTPPGEVKIWITKESAAREEPTRRQYEPVLMAAVETELTKRGYSKASGSPADFDLAYYVLISTGTAAQTAGSFLDFNAQFGIPLFAPQTVSLQVYPQGSIVLDAALPGGPMIWRGIVEAKVETVASETERSKRVRGFMKDVVAKFPKPEKKK